MNYPEIRQQRYFPHPECEHNSDAFFITEQQLAAAHLASLTGSGEQHSATGDEQHQRMKGLLLLYLLYLLGGQGSSECPQTCVCHGTEVDCSNLGLTYSMLPRSFPVGTTVIRLHKNHLTSLPNELLDDLPHLQRVSLHGNPWTCDCGILYLRAWLLRQHSSQAVQLGVNCSSPGNLKGRQVIYLTEEEVLDTCHYWYCDLAMASQISLFLFVILQAGLLAAVVVFLRRFERMSKEARRTMEDSLTPGEAQRENEYQTVRDTSI